MMIKTATVDQEIPESIIKKIQSLQLVIFDFDGVFTDNFVYVDQNGVESVKCSRSDGMGIELLGKIGLKCFIVSTETNPVVGARASKLRIPFVQAVKDKSVTVRQIASDLNINLEEVAFIGNDMNDLPALNVVGLPVGVCDAHHSIDKFVLLKTKACGGNGAVREFCELVFKIKNG
jgi:3-deoxy-D-manno-octulosonate 8-phosphate phosphatase (KDO 8-P phosphatase)